MIGGLTNMKVPKRKSKIETEIIGTESYGSPTIGGLGVIGVIII